MQPATVASTAPLPDARQFKCLLPGMLAVLSSSGRAGVVTVLAGDDVRVRYVDGSLSDPMNVAGFTHATDEQIAAWPWDLWKQEFGEPGTDHPNNAAPHPSPSPPAPTPSPPLTDGSGAPNVH